MKPRVAIIGGGWAGCAAGLRLAQAGVAVSLFEAGNTLGGRARRVQFDELALDNGQHLLLGAYRQTLELIDAVWPDHRDALLRQPLVLEQPPDFLLRCPRLPAPLHLLAGLLGAKGLSIADKLAAARWIQAIFRHPPNEDISVKTLIASQPTRLRAILWEPLCVAALNTPVEHASAKVFVAVLQAAFSRTRADSDWLFPRCDLSRLFPEPAANKMRERGAQILMQSRITHLSVQDRIFILHTQQATYTFDRVIVAVAPQHARRLLDGLPALTDVVAGLASYTYEAIASLYLQYPPQVRLARPMLALANGPAQFVFDRGITHGQPGLLALVTSAMPREPDLPKWKQAAMQQLAAVASLPPPLWHQIIVEKQASYACRPQLYRPQNHTPQTGLFLAGDYTAGPYPATLESATFSGVKSAQLVLDSL